jgi:hypothetical protein
VDGVLDVAGVAAHDPRTPLACDHERLQDRCVGDFGQPLLTADKATFEKHLKNAANARTHYADADAKADAVN